MIAFSQFNLKSTEVKMSTLSLANVTNTYQRHETKLILVVVVFLSLYLLAFAAKITWSFLPSPQTTQNENNKQIQTDIDTGSRDQNINISSITALNLFGDAQAQVAVERQEEVSDVPETKLNLVLSGVVSSSDSNKGAAVIEYRNNQSTYGIGDKIEGTNITVDEIYVDRVIIKNTQVRETLMLEGIDFEEANRKRTAQARTNSSAVGQNSVNTPVASSQSQQSMREKAQAVREARQQLANEPTSFTDMISLSPHRVNNRLVGFRVSPGANPTLFNSVGLKNGDVLVELNGLDLSNLENSREAITQLQTADLLLLQVLRAGEYVDLELEIPEN